MAAGLLHTSCSWSLQTPHFGERLQLGHRPTTQIGREIGKANPNASTQELAEKTFDYFHDKGLYTATTNKDGTVTIGQTQLNDDQYKAASDVLKTTNNNGFTPDQQAQRDAEANKKAQDLQREIQTGPKF